MPIIKTYSVIRPVNNNLNNSINANLEDSNRVYKTCSISSKTFCNLPDDEETILAKSPILALL